MVELFLAGARVALTSVPGYLYTTRSSGLSRTRVDYSTQIRDIEGLLGREGIKGNARLAAVLRQRGRALRRLEAEHGVNRCVYGRDAGRAGEAAGDEPLGGLPELVRVVRRRFGG